MIDAIVGGTLNAKMPEGSMELFEEMAMNNYQWYNFGAKLGKKTHVYDVNTATTMVV